MVNHVHSKPRERKGAVGDAQGEESSSHEHHAGERHEVARARVERPAIGQLRRLAGGLFCLLHRR